MAFVIADRVVETTATTGTGAYSLAGPATGFQSFVSGVGTGNETFYVVTDGTDWEVGIGTVTSGAPDTISRDTVLQSTNSDAAVNWASGTKDIFLTVPADRLVASNLANTLSGANTFSADNTFTAKILFPDKAELTIATGAITVTGINHTIDTEADAATDDLDTINGGADGQILIVRADNDARTVVIKHNTGNIFTDDAEDITLDKNAKAVFLMYDGSLARWQVISKPVDVTVPDASTTVKGIVEKATAAEVTAETANKYPDAADLKSHKGIAKAWVTFNDVGTILESYNVTSVVRNSLGDFTITWSVTSASANEPVQSTAGRTAGNQATPVWYAQTTTTVSFDYRNAGDSAVDPDRATVMLYGELA